MLILEELEHALNRQAHTILAEISNFAYNSKQELGLTASHPQTKDALEG